MELKPRPKCSMCGQEHTQSVRVNWWGKNGEPHGNTTKKQNDLVLCDKCAEKMFSGREEVLSTLRIEQLSKTIYNDVKKLYETAKEQTEQNYYSEQLVDCEIGFDLGGWEAVGDEIDYDASSKEGYWWEYPDFSEVAKENTVLVARVKGVVVGYLIYAIIPEYQGSKKYSVRYLTMYVTEDKRSLGIGTQLFGQLLADFGDEKALYLSTYNDVEAEVWSCLWGKVFEADNSMDCSGDDNHIYKFREEVTGTNVESILKGMRDGSITLADGEDSNVDEEELQGDDNEDSNDEEDEESYGNGFWDGVEDDFEGDFEDDEEEENYFKGDFEDDEEEENYFKGDFEDDFKNIINPQESQADPQAGTQENQAEPQEDKEGTQDAIKLHLRETLKNSTQGTAHIKEDTLENSINKFMHLAEVLEDSQIASTRQSKHKRRKMKKTKSEEDDE